MSDFQEWWDNEEEKGKYVTGRYEAAEAAWNYRDGEIQTLTQQLEEVTEGITIEQAFNVIKQAMIDDNPSERGSYAHSWHCNIAMMCADAIHDDESEALTCDDAHRIGNDAASRFMKLCFDVETK